MENQTPEQRETLWRRKLTDAERAKLRWQPGLQMEARLTDALADLPNAPVPSNFAARVLGAIELDEARARRAERASSWPWNLLELWPRIAVTALVLIVAGLEIQHYQTGQYRAELAQSVAVVAGANAAVPSVDALVDLDAIQHLSQPAPADTDLLADLQ